MNKLKSFKIKKLHGFKNYNLKFKDNTLILVGENGAGKTTILRMLYYIISGQWSTLAGFEFETISLQIENKTFSINNSDLSKKFDSSDKIFLRRFPSYIRRKFLQMFDEYYRGNTQLSEIEMLCERYDVPFHLISRNLNFDRNIIYSEKNEKSKKKLEEIKKAFSETQVLYLPTYRRIEQELSSIFKGIDEDELRHRKHLIRNPRNPNYTELIEFGMKDVNHSIDNILERLKEFARESLNSLTLGYLGDVVDQKYTEVDITQIQNTSRKMITNILERIDIKILSKDSKKHLSKTIDNVKGGKDPDVHEKVICHYFIKLLNFQQELNKKEYKIKKFCEVCSKYMEDKVFEYTSSSFSFAISPTKDIPIKNDVRLDQLSSGEKQIVSLFSHLYLSDENKYFVMIDEPELSLSVPWQRQFLVDIKQGEFCSGIMAVTHSPFIYENELDNYTHGLGEFLTMEKQK
jgi:predicted ATPase